MLISSNFLNVHYMRIIEEGQERKAPPIQQLAFAVRGTGRAGLQAGNHFPEPASTGGRNNTKVLPEES